MRTRNAKQRADLIRVVYLHYLQQESAQETLFLGAEPTLMRRRCEILK
jgi:hypothetical protein